MREGVRRAVAFHNGRFHDEVLMGVLAENFGAARRPAPGPSDPGLELGVDVAPLVKDAVNADRVVVACVEQEEREAHRAEDTKPGDSGSRLGRRGAGGGEIGEPTHRKLDRVDEARGGLGVGLISIALDGPRDVEIGRARRDDPCHEASRTLARSPSK